MGSTPLAPGPPASPLVSVIVPFLNRQRYLAACIEALLSQAPIGGAVEIILVDNGSSDDSAGVAGRYPGVVMIREDRPGVYAARNTAVQRAGAPIIAFTDADCLPAPDWLQAVSAGMRDPDVAVMIGPCAYPEDASFALGLLAAYENAKADYVISHCPPGYRFAYANNMAVRAAVFQQLGGFREWPRAADTELIHRLAAQRPDLRVVFEPSMRVTHMEFRRFRDRFRRLSVYTGTNARIGTFRELGPARRAGVLWHMIRGKAGSGRHA